VPYLTGGDVKQGRTAFLRASSRAHKCRQTKLGPKLPWSFEAALTLATSRFQRNRCRWASHDPQSLIIHPPCLSAKIVFSLRTVSAASPPDGFSAAISFNTLCSARVATDAVSVLPTLWSWIRLPSDKHAPVPTNVPAMIKIQKPSRLRPTVGFQIPYPSTPSAKQCFFGSSQTPRSASQCSRLPNSSGSPCQRTTILLQSFPAIAAREEMTYYANHHRASFWLGHSLDRRSHIRAIRALEIQQTTRSG